LIQLFIIFHSLHSIGCPISLAYRHACQRVTDIRLRAESSMIWSLLIFEIEFPY
jgi:hypothetical protein